MSKGVPAKRSKPKTIPKETLKHYQAFMFYWGLDSDRTHKKVATEYKISTSTVKQWSSRYSWLERIIEMERKVAEKMEADAVASVAKRKQTNLDIVDNLKARFMHVLNSDQDKGLKRKNYIESLPDLDRLFKAELLMLDQPTERVAGGGITFISSVASPDDAD